MLSVQAPAQCGEKQDIGENKKAKVLWALTEAKDRGVDFHDASHEKELKTRAQVRLDLHCIPFQKKKTYGCIGKSLGRS